MGLAASTVLRSWRPLAVCSSWAGVASASMVGGRRQMAKFVANIRATAAVGGVVVTSLLARTSAPMTWCSSSDRQSSHAEECFEHLDDEGMVVGLRQAGDGDAADHADLADTDRERAAVCREQPWLDAQRLV
jgi:hypothetical protein